MPWIPLCAAWLLLALLRALSVASEALDCASASRTVTVQLDRTHVLRTWQPDGDCPWLENRWSETSSETSQFPAAVRSGPRWLVMQLRRPMVLERVSVRSWGGEWQTVGAVGSHVSAVGAASLPLELQLEDPCRASWDAFGRSGAWRQLEGTRNWNLTTPISFILLNSSHSLSFMSVNITGRLSQLQLVSDSALPCALTNLNTVKMSIGDHMCFDVKFCDSLLGGTPVQCSITPISGWVIQLNSISKQHKSYAFDFESSVNLHGALLNCSQGQSMERRVLQTLTMRIVPKEFRLLIPPVWVTGQSVTVNFTIVEAYPEPQNLCWICTSESKLDPRNKCYKLNAATVSKSVVRNKNGLTVITIQSLIEVNVTREILKKYIICEEGINVSSGASNSKSVFYNIAAISEPCVTDVDLGSHRHWQEGEVRQIRVTSRNCSIWNASHSCWLIDSTAKLTEQLHKINESNFTSIHQLSVSRWMSQRDWSVRCRVNQSGVLYDDVVSLGNQQPKVFNNLTDNLADGKAASSGDSDSSDPKPPGSAWKAFTATPMLLATVISTTLAALLLLSTFVVGIRKLTTACTGGSGEPEVDASGGDAVQLQHLLAATSCADEEEQIQPPKPALAVANKFVTVVNVFTILEDEVNEACPEDNNLVYQRAAGHYEPDGCTFVQYGKLPSTE